jgi:hypothetical protein
MLIALLQLFELIWKTIKHTQIIYKVKEQKNKLYVINIFGYLVVRVDIFFCDSGKREKKKVEKHCTKDSEQSRRPTTFSYCKAIMYLQSDDYSRVSLKPFSWTSIKAGINIM